MAIDTSTHRSDAAPSGPEGLQALATRVFGDSERAQHWLCHPKQRLHGRTPLEAAAHAGKGEAAVRAWLHEIDEGSSA